MLTVLSLVPTGLALAEETDKSSPNFGKKFFLWNALPGESVLDYTPLKQKRTYCEAVATQIAPSTLSPFRVAEKDPCYLSTSPWQIFTWDYELAQKRILVEQSLAQEKIPLSVPVSPVVTDHREWHYRNKMEYSLYWDNSDNQIYLAFRQRGSHRKIPACTSELCICSSIERPEIAEKALKIVQELNSTHASARDYQSLLLRTNQEGIVSGGLLPNGKSHPVFPNLTDKILGQEYSYSPNGFFQVNLPVYELTLEEIKKYIVSDRVLDLYSGVGTIGLSVARDTNLTLVESNPSAFRELKKNVKGVSLVFSSDPARSELARKSRTSPKAIFCKSEDALDLISPDQTVILDPPRAGCAPVLINRLLEQTPERIIYLSCNPSTQARDVRLLTESKKYQILQITPFNFFPKTPHIENLIVLSRTH